MQLDESTPTQDEILMVLEPDIGIGYQMIAAFARLGNKSMVPGKLASYNLAPLQALESESSPSSASAWLASPTTLLQEQRILDALEKSALKDYLQKAKEQNAHFILILPMNTPTEDVQSFLSLHSKTTIILAPKPVGFRDLHFFETVIGSLRQQKGVSWQQLKEQTSFEGIFISDICGFLISIIGKPSFFQKTLIAPSVNVAPCAIVESLEEILEFRPTFFEKFRAKLKPSTQAQTLQRTANPLELLKSMPSAHEILDLLPTTLTPCPIWVKKVAGYLERNPESDLHFPPTRIP